MVKGTLAAAAITVAAAARSVTWTDLPAPVAARLQQSGLSSVSFPQLLDRLHRTHAQRVREGDLDHLVFYLLQSTHFTKLPAIEPALSARELVDGLAAADRQTYLSRGTIDVARVPPAVRARAHDLLRALDSPDPDPRLVYFRRLAMAALPEGPAREHAVLEEYLRGMRFLYEKEFVAQRAPDAADAVAALYHARGLSTDTAVEAGYVVYLGLGVLKSLDPDRRVGRVLIVGPGLDLAPRTALLDATPPESYQPWAVIDALLDLGLSKVDDLDVIGADINPRVVEHLHGERASPPLLHLTSGLQLSPQLTLERDYRDYFDRLGNAIAVKRASPVERNGRLTKTIEVQAAAARALAAESLDIVTERLTGPPFDVVIATNIFPYFDDTELALALANIAGMLAPGGVLLHNEPRVVLRQLAADAGLELLQSRQVPIARVAAAPPLADTIFLYRRR